MFWAHLKIWAKAVGGAASAPRPLGGRAGCAWRTRWRAGADLRASQAHLRARMAGSTSRHAFPGVRAPQWTSKAFLGEFGDAFVQATDLEGGQTYQSIPEYCAVVREAMTMPGDALSLLRGSRDGRVVEQVLDKLQQAADLSGSPNDPKLAFAQLFGYLIVGALCLMVVGCCVTQRGCLIYDKFLDKEPYNQVAGEEDAATPK